MRAERQAKVAVIGGGIAGLVAAWELSGFGIEVELYEQSGELGGRVCGQEILGHRVDVGAESFSVRDETVQHFLQDLGCAHLVQRPNPHPSWVHHHTRCAPLPMLGAMGIPVSPLSRKARAVLGLRGSLRAASEPFLPGWVGNKASSVADVVRRRSGHRVLDRLVSPVTRGVYSTDPSALNPGALPARTCHWWGGHSLTAHARAHRQRAEGKGAAVASLQGGMNTLVQELCAQIIQRHVSIRLCTTVTDLRQDDASFWVAGRTESGARFETRVSSAIVTVPGVSLVQTAAQPNGYRPTESAQDAGAVAGRVEVVALMLRHAGLDHAPRGNGVLVAATPPGIPASIRAKALTHCSAKWGWIAEALPRSYHLIRLSYGVTSQLQTESACLRATSQASYAPRLSPASHADAGTLALSDVQVRDLARDDASQILGVDIGPQHVVGMTRKSHQVFTRETLHKPQSVPRIPCAGVFRAGEWVSGVGLAAVIPAARAVARECYTHILGGAPATGRE